MITCPNCRRINVNSASRCDCNYDFSLGRVAPPTVSAPAQNVVCAWFAKLERIDPINEEFEPLEMKSFKTAKTIFKSLFSEIVVPVAPVLGTFVIKKFEGGKPGELKMRTITSIADFGRYTWTPANDFAQTIRFVIEDQLFITGLYRNLTQTLIFNAPAHGDTSADELGRIMIASYHAYEKALAKAREGQ